MLKLKNYCFAALVAIFIFMFSACEQEKCGVCNSAPTYCNTPPTINSQSFEIFENLPNGSVVDTVIVDDADIYEKLIFEIIGGNSQNVWRD